MAVTNTVGGGVPDAPAYSDQNVLQRLPNALLQARNAGAHPPGHALERSADAVPPSRFGGAASGRDAEAEKGAIRY